MVYFLLDFGLGLEVTVKNKTKLALNCPYCLKSQVLAPLAFCLSSNSWLYFKGLLEPCEICHYQTLGSEN